MFIQTDDTLWSGVASFCQEKYGMKRSKASIRCKWGPFALDCQLWNSCYKQVLKLNRTGNMQKDSLVKQAHGIFQSRRRKEKERNPGIGTTFKYVEAAEYLAKIPKFGDVDGNGGVNIERTRHVRSGGKSDEQPNGEDNFGMTGSMKGRNIVQRLEYETSPSETRHGEGYDRTESTGDQR